MKRIASVLLCALVPCTICATPSMQGVSPGENSQLAVTESYQIGAIKQLRKGVDAWPLITNPNNSAAQRVNATLTRLNRRLALSLRQCDADYLKWLDLVGGSANQAPISEDWLRTIEVTMTGPRFLSLVATDGAFCGGAHPDSDRIAMVFDMTTGATVNWVTKLSKSAGASAITDAGMDGSTIGALILPAFQTILTTSATADCKDSFQDPQPLLIWPNAKRETLVVQPFDIPHVEQVCADEIELTMEQARKLGFDENLLNAIKQAHRQSTPTSSHPTHLQNTSE